MAQLLGYIWFVVVDSATRCLVIKTDTGIYDTDPTNGNRPRYWVDIEQAAERAWFLNHPDDSATMELAARRPSPVARQLSSPVIVLPTDRSTPVEVVNLREESVRGPLHNGGAATLRE